MRITFIEFCQKILQYISKEMFKAHFFKDLIGLGQDSFPAVRIEVAKSMVLVKPYFMDDQDVAIEITEMLSHQ